MAVCFLLLLTLASASVISVISEKTRFDNYRILSVKTASEKQREYLRTLDEMSDSVDILFVMENGNAEVLVAPHKLADVEDLFSRTGIQSETKHGNFQELLDIEQPANQSNIFSWSGYYNYDIIYAWLDEKLKENPQILTNVVIGKSFENRTIRGVKLSHKKNNPTVFIDAAIHAREWITPPTVTYFLNELLTSEDPIIVDLATNIDWVIVPVFNIDGYSWSHTNDRLWRKTRQPYKQCVGADPNRNFDVRWGTVGTSTNPCTDTYGGPRPFSEPETLAVANYLKGIQNLRMYLTFHSFGQYLMFPYGFNGPAAPNHNDLMQVARAGGNAIRQRFGTIYTVGRSSTTLYPAAGGSDDWAYAFTNASLSFIFELRDRSSFILPPNQIIPNSQEIVDGLGAMIAEARKLNYI